MTALERPSVDWERHKGTGAPKILPPPGVEWRNPKTNRKVGHRYYTRVTTYADAITESYMLTLWKLRRVLVGVGQRPDYHTLAASLTIEDRDRAALDELAQKCLEAAGPDRAAIGTALHAFTERIDRGEPLGYVPAEYLPLVEAYRRLVEPLTFTHREVRTVNDEHEVAGTPDGFAYCTIPDPDGVVDPLRVVDTKTGSLRYPGKMSTQLATYARSDLYDPATAERAPIEVDRRWGLIVHLMSDGSEPPGLYWLNLEHGNRGLELCGPVRAWHKVKAEDILRPALVEEAPPATPAAPRRVDEPGDITEAIKVASERVDPAGIGDDVPRQGQPLEALPELEAVPGEPLPEVSASAYAPDAVELEAPAPADIDDQGCPAERHHGVDCPGDACRFAGIEAAPERCELSDLLVSECACRVHRPDVPAGALDDGDESTDITAELEGEQRESDGQWLVDPIAEAILRAVAPRELELLWRQHVKAGGWQAVHDTFAAQRHRELVEQRELERPRAALTAALEAAETPDELAVLWHEHGAGPGPVWTDEHTQIATRRHAELAA